MPCPEFLPALCCCLQLPSHRFLAHQHSEPWVLAADPGAGCSEAGLEKGKREQETRERRDPGVSSMF